MNKEPVKARKKTLDAPDPLTVKECECLIRFPKGSNSEKQQKEMIFSLIQLMNRHGYALVSQTAEFMNDIYKDRSKIEHYQGVKDAFERSKSGFFKDLKVEAEASS